MSKFWWPLSWAPSEGKGNSGSWEGVPEGEEGLGQPWGLVAGRFLGSLSEASGLRGFKTVGQLVSFIVKETKTTEVE